ncbi:MAG: transposase [Anaerolineae bacterium]
MAGRCLRVGVITLSLYMRLRRDRVLYQAPPQSTTRRRGRPRKHGARFAFQDPTTWGPTAEILEFEDAHYGTVRLERWNNLHERTAAEVSYDVLRASIHREHVKPPAPIWFAWQAPSSIP